MKDLSYFVKDIKNKDDKFYFKILSESNRNTFVLEDMLENIFEYHNIDGDICLIESTKSNINFKCIYKTDETFDDKLWTIKKRKDLVDLMPKCQLQNIEIVDNQKVHQMFYVLPISTKERNYYLILDEMDNTKKSKYAVIFETIFFLLKTCETNELLSKYSTIDTVTGCYNFNQFQKSLAIEMAKIDRISDTNVVFSVIYLDIKELKKINDKFGYAIGDSVLKFVANSIKTKIRQTDSAFRISEDEFCIIASYATTDICKNYILERITQSLEQRIKLAEDVYYTPKLSTSIFEYKKGCDKNTIINKLKEGVNLSRRSDETVILD